MYKRHGWAINENSILYYEMEWTNIRRLFPDAADFSSFRTQPTPFTQLARVELALAKSPSVVCMLDLTDGNLDQPHIDDFVSARVKRVIVVGHGKIVDVELAAVFLAVLDPGLDRSVRENNITLTTRPPDRRERKEDSPFHNIALSDAKIG
jgi:hypothetical protein